MTHLPVSDGFWGGGPPPMWATAQGNKIASSKDNGASWQVQTVSAFTGIYGIAKNASGTYVIVGKDASGSKIATSTDFSTWTANSSQPFAAGDSSGCVVAVIWSQRLGLFVAAGYKGVFTSSTAVPYIITSPDGKTWTQQTVPYTTSGQVGGNGQINQIVDDGTNIIVVGGDKSASQAVLWKSTDAVTWSKVSVNTSYSGTVAFGIAAATGYYLVAQANQPPQIRRTTDLVNFTSPSYPGTPLGMDSNGSTVVLSMYGGSAWGLYTTTDGNSYTLRQSTGSDQGGDVRYSATKGRWMVVTYGDVVWTSDDNGVTWANRGSTGLGAVSNGALQFLN